MRLTKAQIVELTGYRRKSMQVKWFHEHLNVIIPADSNGPILTPETYELLLKKRLGILPSQSNDTLAKPSIRLLKKS